MIIPATNAPAYIGHINPGVAYWWFQTNGQWFLYLPEPSTASRLAQGIWPGVLLAVCVMCLVEWKRKRGGVR